MHKIERLTKQLDKAITELHDEYVKAHEELNKHRGKPIDETNLAEVNRLLKLVQEQFAQLYPALHFINSRYQYAVNSTNGYNEFIETLKKAGAQQNESETK